MFNFTNRRNKEYSWDDAVPLNDPTLQGLLQEDAPFPDIPEELPGVLLEGQEGPQPAVEEEPEPNEERLAELALENAGLHGGRGPVPAERGNLVVPPNDDDNEAGVAGGNEVDEDPIPLPQEQEPAAPLPPGIPVVEDVVDTDVEEADLEEDNQSAGVLEHNEDRPGVPEHELEDGGPPIQGDDELGGRRYP